MNRLTISLLIALIVFVVTGLTAIVFQQRTISSLREENGQQIHTAGTQDGIPASDIPGRYRWIENGVERGFITLKADRSAVGLSGKSGWGGTPNRWFHHGGELVVTWGTTHTLFTQSNAPGSYSGKEGNKSIQIIREP